MSEEPNFYDGGRVDLLDCNNDIPKIKNKAEALYIKKRKIKAMLESICFYICRVFPVKKKRVCICTFEGVGGFCCNPKYIAIELHKREPESELVWMVDDMSKEFPESIRKVPHNVWSRAYWMSTSKIWIDNYRTRYGTKKRRGQFYLNTWHGMMGFKSIGLWRGDSFSEMAYLVSKSDSDLVDYFLCDSDFTESFFPKGLIYDGEFLKVGSPRCDVLLKSDRGAKERLIKKYGLDENVKFVMYAPTFREFNNSGRRSIDKEDFSIDFERLTKNLTKRFGGRWIVCLRLHPQLKSEKYNTSFKDIIDLSGIDDMYEVLNGMDVFITDYSSCSMDAEMMHIPVFIYADDLNEYKSSRGDFVWDLEPDTRGYASLNKEMFPDLSATLPFSIAKNNDELEQDILQFDSDDYIKKLSKFEKDVGLVVDGRATEHTVDEIIKHLG